MDKKYTMERMKYNIQEYHNNGTLGKTVILIQLSYYLRNDIVTKDEYDYFIDLLYNNEKVDIDKYSNNTKREGVTDYV